MSRIKDSRESFVFIEISGSVTAEEYAEFAEVSLPVAKNWLSRWTRRGCLVYIPAEKSVVLSRRGRPSGGKYKLNASSWKELRDNYVSKGVA
jgi:hypothetical protein